VGIFFFLFLLVSFFFFSPFLVLGFLVSLLLLLFLSLYFLYFGFFQPRDSPQGGNRFTGLIGNLISRLGNIIQGSFGKSQVVVP